MPKGIAPFIMPAFRSCVIIFGCRLVIRMRKLASQTRTKDVGPWKGGPGHTLRSRHHSVGPEAMSYIEVEVNRIDSVLDIAQRVGLPPPLKEDLESMWFDPIVTLNSAQHCSRKTSYWKTLRNVTKNHMQAVQSRPGKYPCCHPKRRPDARRWQSCGRRWMERMEQVHQ